MKVPESLVRAMREVTVIVGHYGAGKTNFALNLAVDLAGEGHQVTLIDLDVVNPYFRAAENRKFLDDFGVKLIAPVFAEAGSSLDVPSLTGKIEPAIQAVHDNAVVIIDAGGDDVGATALGRYAGLLESRGYAMIYLANAFRNLVQDPQDALENIREIEFASHLRATALVNNSHLQDATSSETLSKGIAYAHELAGLAHLDLAATCVPADCEADGIADSYRVTRYVTTPWERM